jgi:hypothetical protein
MGKVRQWAKSRGQIKVMSSESKSVDTQKKPTYSGLWIAIPTLLIALLAALLGDTGILPFLNGENDTSKIPEVRQTLF